MLTDGPTPAALSRRTSVGGGDDGEKQPLIVRRTTSIKRTNSKVSFAPLPNEDPMPSAVHMMAVSGAGLALDLLYSVESAYAMPTFLQYKLPARYVSFVFLMSPILGIFLTPILGQKSDNCSLALGRRRPFIILFGVIAALGFLGFARSESIAHAISPRHGHVLTIAIAVVTFLAMDFGCDNLNMPARSLIADLVPSKYQDRASSLYSLMAGIGAFVGYLAGAFDISALAPSWLGSNVQVLFTYCTVLFAAAIAMTVFAGKEQSLEEIERAATVFTPLEPSSEPSIGELLRALWRMPPCLARAFVMATATWITGCSVMFFISDWCGKVLFNGSPTGDAAALASYTDGVRFASLLFAGSAIVTMAWSLILPPLMARTSVELPFVLTQVAFGVSLVFLHFYPSRAAMGVVMFFFGVTYANQSTVPYAIAALVASDDEVGLFTAVISVTVASAQLVVALAAGPLMEQFEISSYLAGVGGFSVLGACIMCTLRRRDGSRVIFQVDDGKPMPHERGFMRQRTRRQSYIRHARGVGILESSVVPTERESLNSDTHVVEHKDTRSHLVFIEGVGIISSFADVDEYVPPDLGSPCAR